MCYRWLTKTTLDIDLSGTGMPADRIKMIKERMKNNLERTYEFTFDKTASIYKQEEQLEQAGGPGGGTAERWGCRSTVGNRWRNGYLRPG